MKRTKRAKRLPSRYRSCANPFSIQWFPIPDEYCRLVGTNIPEELAEHFSIMSTYYGITRSEALRRLLEEWLDKCPTKEEAIEELADRAYESWKVLWWENRWRPTWWNAMQAMKRFEQYISRAKRLLMRRGLSAKTVDEIVRRTKEKMLIDSEFSPFERPLPAEKKTRNPTIKKFPSIDGDRV